MERVAGAGLALHELLAGLRLGAADAVRVVREVLLVRQVRAAPAARHAVNWNRAGRRRGCSDQNTLLSYFYCIL